MLLRGCLIERNRPHHWWTKWLTLVAYQYHLQNTIQIVSVNAFTKGGQLSIISQGYGQPVVLNTVQAPDRPTWMHLPMSFHELVPISWVNVSCHEPDTLLEINLTARIHSYRQWHKVFRTQLKNTSFYRRFSLTVVLYILYVILY